MKYQLRQPVVLFGAAIIILIGIGLAFRMPIDRQLRSWKLLPEPERLTELYFTYPNALPTKYIPGQPQTVKFTVHNLEYQTTNYSYLIKEVSQDGSRSQNLATSRFTLPQNAYQHATVNIPTVDLGANVKVEVRLVSQNESIDYLLKRSGL